MRVCYHEGFPQNKHTRNKENDHVSFTQNKEARAKDEKVGGLESMLSGPQRYEQHTSCGHSQARVQDYIGRPGHTSLVAQPFCCDHLVFSKSIFLLIIPGVLSGHTWWSSWSYLVFSRSSFLLMFAAARFDSSRFTSFRSTSGTETCPLHDIEDSNTLDTSCHS